MDDTQSYIDDRCPTVWGPPSAKPRDVLYEATPHRQEQPTHQDVPRSLPAGLNGVAPREGRRVKPIDGALLRKLFQATMEQKRRVAERERAAQQGYGDIRNSADEEPALKGFYVPKSYHPSAKGGERVGKEKSKTRPQNKTKKETTDKKVGAEKKDKKKAPASVAPAAADSPVSDVLQEEHEGSAQDDDVKASSEVRPEPETQKATRKEKSKRKGNQGPSQGQEQPANKPSKKEKKKQKQAENSKANSGAETAEALMSGGLLAENNETSSNRDGAAHLDDFIEVGEGRCQSWEQKAPEPRSPSRAGTVHLQPTVESVTSSRSSKRGKISSKPQSTRSVPHESFPTAEPWSTEVDKPATFVSWEEIGQGVVGEDVVRVALRIASSKHSSKARSGNVFEGFDHAWDVPEEDEVVSRHHSSKTEMRHASDRSSKGHRSKGRHSRHSRHSRVSHHSQTPVGNGEHQDQLWQEEEPANTRSKASSRRTVVPTVANDMDPWTQGGLDEVASRQSSSKHGSRVRSQLTFEEVGEGWAEAPPEVLRSGKSAVSTHSKPFSFHETRGASQAWSQRSSERERRSTAGTFEEIGKGWKDPDGVEALARSRQTSLRSREVSSHAWNAHEQGQSESGPPQSGQDSEKGNGTWEEIEEHTSAVRSTESAGRSHSTSHYERDREEVRPTVFAGKGWISPHPLSRSPTEMASPPQSKIVLPSQAYPHGATMTYEQWQALQEEGMRRNISPTESHLTINARRAQSRHRFAGWGAHSSDGHRFEESIREDEAEASVSGPASYRVPSMDSERSSGGLLSDERPPTQEDTYVHDLAHKSTWGGTWEEQHASERSEQSRQHSRVQTLSEWSHEHSGSKQAHDGSGLTGEGGSRDSSRPSSQHDSDHNLHRSSRQSRRQSGSHRSSRHSSHKHSHHSDKRSESVRSQPQSVGWGRLSLGTARSRKPKRHESESHKSHRSSHHTGRRSSSYQSKTVSDDSKASSHDTGESGHTTRHSDGHSSHRHSRHSNDRSASAQSEAHAADSTQSPHSSVNSRHKSSHHSSNHRSHRTSHRTPSAQSSARPSSIHHASAASMSSNERMQEVMEEGRNVWSDIPQYDGTVSDREQYIERSDLSAIPTSQLYWKRYRGDGEDSGVERWE
ncbi:hypothetical protein M409DRAFT_57360 [Zasmidium cellare ATCC 36951]|uniref:Uncharacterized protein n=1 Tax=Zasmidium cellare ATCC 36951 TaxID=1080233 RepID=A0A6A6C8I1_ZASCE|nr:uncharacterized protein M409DRAFT_57360 [Zasmidium cellare ATCC 36951]KAF2163454.1 hypothetical protein M409DRAFT_57360 [Zasmidium cellare ATCC 36951]